MNPDTAPEPFVSAEVAAEFLGVKRRLLLSMARLGIAGAYPIGTGKIRKQWIFRISELTTAVAPPPLPRPCQEPERRL
jgi:hypothetical protein